MGQNLHFYVEKQQSDGSWVPIAPAKEHEELTKVDKQGTLVWYYPYRNSLLFDALKGDGYLCSTAFCPDNHPGPWSLLLDKYSAAELKQDRQRAAKLLVKDYPSIHEDVLDDYDDFCRWQSLTLSALQKYDAWDELRAGNLGQILVEELSRLGGPEKVRFVLQVS